jgi:hypothetical protein
MREVRRALERRRQAAQPPIVDEREAEWFLMRGSILAAGQHSARSRRGQRSKRGSQKPKAQAAGRQDHRVRLPEIEAIAF